MTRRRVIKYLRVKVPLKFHLCKSLNEIKGLIDVLHVIKKKDILVVDRLYFGFELIDLLVEKQINFVCRLKKSLNIVKELIRRNTNDMVTHIKINGKRIILTKRNIISLEQTTDCNITASVANKRSTDIFLYQLYITSTT